LQTEPQKWATGVEALIFFLPNLVPDLADLERNNSKSQFLKNKRFQLVAKAYRGNPYIFLLSILAKISSGGMVVTLAASQNWKTRHCGGL
jgi:hypothetical protein